jgi:hypothetical protein
MYDYDDMKCHAYDCHANACVTPECYNLNFVALSGFLGMFKHVNTREEICPKLKVI